MKTRIKRLLQTTALSIGLLSPLYFANNANAQESRTEVKTGYSVQNRDPDESYLVPKSRQLRINYNIKKDKQEHSYSAPTFEELSTKRLPQYKAIKSAEEKSRPKSIRAEIVSEEELEKGHDKIISLGRFPVKESWLKNGKTENAEREDKYEREISIDRFEAVKQERKLVKEKAEKVLNKEKKYVEEIGKRPEAVAAQPVNLELEETNQYQTETNTKTKKTDENLIEKVSPVRDETTKSKKTENLEEKVNSPTKVKEIAPEIYDTAPKDTGINSAPAKVDEKYDIQKELTKTPDKGLVTKEYIKEKPTAEEVDPYSIPDTNTNSRVLYSAPTNSVEKSKNDRPVKEKDKLNDSLEGIFDIFQGPKPTNKNPESVIPASTNNYHSVPNNIPNDPVKLNKEERKNDKEEKKSSKNKPKMYDFKGFDIFRIFSNNERDEELTKAIRVGMESADNLNYSQVVQYAALDSDMPLVYQSTKKTLNKNKIYEMPKKIKVKKNKQTVKQNQKNSKEQEERPKAVPAIKLTEKELAEYHAVKRETVKINKDKYEIKERNHYGVPKSQQVSSGWNYSAHSTRGSMVTINEARNDVKEPKKERNSEQATKLEEREESKQDKESDKMKEYFEIIQMAVEKETGIAGENNYLNPKALNARYYESGKYFSWGLSGLNKSSLSGFLKDSYQKEQAGLEGYDWANLFIDKKTGKLIGPNNKNFGNAWEYISHNHTNDFAKAQVMYTIDNFYKDVIEFLEEKYGLKEEELPKDFKNLMCSMSVNSGPTAKKIIRIALGNGSIENLPWFERAKKITEERSRSIKNKKGQVIKLIHKPKASKKEIKGLLDRFSDEGQRARSGCLR